MNESKVRIKELRTRLNLSQEALGKLAGVTRQAIALYEEGERSPSLTVGMRMAVALGVHPKYMIGESDDPKIDDRLPDEWVRLVAEIMSRSRSPEDVLKALQVLESVETALAPEPDKPRKP